jgi:hypothetical protein
VEDFVISRGISRTGSIENDMYDINKSERETLEAQVEADTTPPMKGKVKKSGSSNRLLAII